jgi:hypothetical protein
VPQKLPLVTEPEMVRAAASIFTRASVLPVSESEARIIITAGFPAG